MTTIDIIKEYICDEVFQNGYPHRVNDEHPFDFFMSADLDSSQSVEDSILGMQYGFEVAEEYIMDNIRSIRGLMQSKLDDLIRLQEKIDKVKHCITVEKIRNIKSFAGLKVPDEIEIMIGQNYSVAFIPHCKKAEQAIEYFNKNPDRKWQKILEEASKI